VVVGGYGNDLELLKSVEVFDFSEERRLCPLLPDFPEEVESFTMAFYGGKLVGCGGYAKDGDLGNCFELGPTLESWEKVSDPLPMSENSLKSSVIDNVMFMSGGFHESSGAFKSTFFYDGVNINTGLEMPEGKVNHCQLTINATHIFITGNTPTNTFMLDWVRQEWIIVDNIPNVLEGPACGILNNPELGPEILVASENLSFIFSLTNLEWREGPVLPDERLIDMSYAQIEGGFLAIGGYINHGFEFSDKIYRFNENSYEWEVQDMFLESPRSRSGAVSVPDDFLNCQ